MAHVVAVPACLVALVFGSLPAAATSPAPSVQLDIGIVLERAESEMRNDVIDATVDRSMIEDHGSGELPPIELLEPAASDEAWEEQGDAPGVAFSVTDEISLGVNYELEELEELTADRIVMGTAGADHESHNVLLRAHWRFDLKP